MKINSQPVFLGLDYGDRHIGAAVSDALLLTAQPLETIRRSGPESIKKPMARLEEIIKVYGVTSIVLGFPKNMDNSLGYRCQATLDFKNRLERFFKKTPVILWDERLTTAQAERGLAHLNKARRKQAEDQAAAQLILQNYLDFYRNQQRSAGELK